MSVLQIEQRYYFDSTALLIRIFLEKAVLTAFYINNYINIY